MGNDSLNSSYQNLETEYFCSNCGNKTIPALHCRHPMHLEKLNDKLEWVCWMGASCGHSEYQSCCESPSLPVYVTINP